MMTEDVLSGLSRTWNDMTEIQSLREILDDVVVMPQIYHFDCTIQKLDDL